MNCGSSGSSTHNTKVVRLLITYHFAEEFQTDHRNIQSALKALRLSARQALHEGWLSNWRTVKTRSKDRYGNDPEHPLEKRQ